jgi:hypothetical protein
MSFCRCGEFYAPHRLFSLFTYIELFNNRAVTVYILALQIIEKRTAVTDHLEKTAARMVIVLVNLQVLGKLVDSLGQDCDLNLRRAGIRGVQTVVLNNRFLDFGLNNVISPFCLYSVNSPQNREKSG